VIFRSGYIRTLDNLAPLAESLAIDKDRVVAVGSNDEIEDIAGPETTIEDLEGRIILPGLTDAHIHLEKYTHNLNKVNVEVSSLQTCLDRVWQRVKETQPGEWILGHGWNQNQWERFGTAADLDRVSPDNPVYLTAKSLHAGWGNTLALELGGITYSSSDPQGGQIQRDASGAPTGILLEEAMRLASDVIPVPTVESTGDALPEAQAQLWRYGITAVHDFDGSHCFQALQLLRERGQLGLRVVNNILVDDLEHALGLGLSTGCGDEWMRVGNIKVFADGALGPRTAAMLAPYDGEPDNTGMCLLDKEELLEIFIRAAKGGLAMAVHAIGDLANRNVLDALADLRRFETENGLPHLHHRIEHLQLLHPNDLSRPAEYDIIASMQPIHATSDMEMADRYWGSRVKYAYAWRSQLQAGATLAFGSDAPVESPNPFLGLHAAVTRRRRDGSPGLEGWISAERLSVHEALLGYTHGPACAAGSGSILGRLAIGSMADLIVLEDDPYVCEEEALAEIMPVGTMVGGTWRYRTF